MGFTCKQTYFTLESLCVYISLYKSSICAWMLAKELQCRDASWLERPLNYRAMASSLFFLQFYFFAKGRRHKLQNVLASSGHGPMDV